MNTLSLFILIYQSALYRHAHLIAVCYYWPGALVMLRAGGRGLEVADASVQWGPWRQCSSPLSLGGLAPADYKLQVRATDGSGNTEEDPAEFAWRVEPDASKVRSCCRHLAAHGRCSVPQPIYRIS